MDSSQFLDPYARRQVPSMALSTSLSSGQPYYTVESLEGATSLPHLKPGFTPPAPLPSERDAIFRLDSQTKALLADRETLDARARLLAADREALMRRNVPGAPLTDRRAYADGLLPADARTRLDGLPPVDARTRLSLDELQALDLRARVHGLDVRSHDALRPALDDRARALAPISGRAQEHRSFSEMIRTREVAAGSRSGPPADYLHGRRDFTDVRAPAMPLDSSTRRDITSRPSASSFRLQRERPFLTGKQEPAALRPAPSEAARNHSKSFANVKTPPVKPKTKPPPEQSGVTNVKTPPLKAKTTPPPELSEGWCAVCKIDCHNFKTLGMHVGGKKHKSMVEGNSAKVNEASVEGKSIPAVTNQADRKRSSDAKPETSQSAKRPKTLALAIGNGVPSADTPDARKGKGDDSKKEKAKTPVTKNVEDNSLMPGGPTAVARKGKDNDFKKEKAKTPVTKNGKDNVLVCAVCKLSTTGQKNLESHLKGKRHAARVKELANTEA